MTVKTDSAFSFVLSIRPQTVPNSPCKMNTKKYHFGQHGTIKRLLLNNGVYSSLSLALAVN